MVKVAAWVGHTIIRSTALCHLVAALVCASVFAGVTIFYDRSTPFDYLPSYSTPNVLHPGQASTLTMRMSAVRKVCPGEFERWFYDAKGTAFYLGTFPTIYQNYVGLDSDARSFDKDWAVPLTAKAGPGFYESRPRFWCNPMQRLYPIEAPRMRVMVTVL